jgi:EAL domain-containing protein (putative c-di-GMP-specific phosphodiesterase class I)
MQQSKPFSATDGPLDFDAVCQKVRAAVDAARVHAISLHDAAGDVLYMTESSMGPDEHNAVREAFDAFKSAEGRPILAYDLGDSRSAVLLRAVDSRSAMVGAIMMVLSGVQRNDAGLSRLANPKMQRALTDFVSMHAGAAAAKVAPAPGRASTPAKVSASVKASGSAVSATAKASTPARTFSPAALPAGSAPVELSLADSMRMRRPPPPGSNTTSSPVHTAQAGTAAKPVNPAPWGSMLSGSAPSGPPPLRPTAVAQASPAAEARPVPPVSPEVDRLNAALRRSPLSLHVQRLVPLNKGGELKRYEVLLRSSDGETANAAPQAMLKAAVEHGLGSMIDRRVLTQLIAWLVRHPEVWRSQAVMFSVNLTSTALQDEHFMKFVGLCLAKAELPPSMIGFEMDVPTAVKMGREASAVAAALNALGCPLVLDDFGMRTECFDLLRLPAVRYIKLASAITSRMRTDKLSQAAITAVVQMARVLGMHTVAKRTESAAEHEWLTALGVDFIQSNALSPSMAIDTLLPTS